MNTRTHEVLALGHDAWQMIGRTPGYIVAVRPLRGGAITDFDITERMIRLLLKRAGIRFTGKADFGAILQGELVTKLASPPGFEPGFQP